MQLDHAAFNEAMEQGGEWFVEFYAPWCGHCARFAPAYEKAAQQLAGAVAFGKVDGTEDRALMGRFPVGGFPTIFHIKDGAVRRYAGGRSAEGLVAFHEGGFESVEAMAFVWSPLGPLMRAKGAAVGAVFGLAGLHKGLAAATGLPELVAGFALMVAAVVATALGIVGVAVWWGDDRRPPGRRPHAD